MVAAACIAAAALCASAQDAGRTGGGAVGAAQSNGEAAVPAAVDETRIALGDETVAESDPSGPSSLGAIIRTVLALAVTAVAVYGVVYLLKRVTRQPDAKDPHLRVLASAHLGSNRFVHVVSLGQKAWLLGASDGGVDLIAEVDDPEMRDTLLLDDSRRQAERANAFSFDFKALMKKFGAADKSEPVSGADAIRKRRERLRGL